MKPSDFPRDIRFRTPGPAIVENGAIHLRSYADVLRVLNDREDEEFSSDHSHWVPDHDDRLHLSWYFMWATGKIRKDGSPGRHEALRGLVEPWFRNKAMKTMHKIIQREARFLLRSIIQKGTGEFDLANEFAYRFAMRNICNLVGLPLEREHWMREQSEAFAQLSGFEQIQREPKELEDYFRQVVHDREQHPQDELLDLLIQAWRKDQISEVELFGYIWGMFQAGTDTTGTNIANAFTLLSEYNLLEEAKEKLDDEEWMKRTGEEILRFGTPFPAGISMTLKEIVLEEGITIPANTQIQFWYSAANRDPIINGNNADASSPEVFDIHRWPNQHVSFGSGVHYCLGAQLARLETRIALQMALQYLPELELDTTQPFVRYAGLVDGVKQAHFRFHQQQAEQLLNQL